MKSKLPPYTANANSTTAVRNSSCSSEATTTELPVVAPVPMMTSLSTAMRSGCPSNIDTTTELASTGTAPPSVAMANSNVSAVPFCDAAPKSSSNRTIACGAMPCGSHFVRVGGGGGGAELWHRQQENLSSEAPI